MAATVQATVISIDFIITSLFLKISITDVLFFLSADMKFCLSKRLIVVLDFIVMIFYFEI